MRKFGFFALFVISYFVTAVAPVSATANVTLDTITSVDRPTDIATRAGDPALYIAEQDGKVIRFLPSASGKGRSSVALDLTSLTNANGEQGLLGITFHPRGSSMFVNYTNKQGDTVVARYAMRADGKAATSSRTILFTLDQPYANHNSGGLSFGPGDRLFVGTGDGGSGGDPERYALNRKSLLGKIISIDPNASGTTTNDARIWAVGLRNPWRFEFDSDNNLWIADVGQNAWEEVNVVWAADGSGRNANFGWSAYEGNVSTATSGWPSTPVPCTCTNTEMPAVPSLAGPAFVVHVSPLCATGTCTATTAAATSRLCGSQVHVPPK
jgi:glucose/arabinose dehydrogenase